LKQEHIIDIVEGLFKQQPLPFMGMSALIPVIGYLFKYVKTRQGNALFYPASRQRT